jgi:hypothetical protein
MLKQRSNIMNTTYRIMLELSTLDFGSKDEQENSGAAKVQTAHLDSGNKGPEIQHETKLAVLGIARLALGDGSWLC